MQITEFKDQIPKEEVKEIKIDLIYVDNSINIRVSEQKDIAKFAKSIQKLGLIHPITVRELKENEKKELFKNYKKKFKFKLIAGNSRYLACKFLNYDYISANIKDKSIKLLAIGPSKDVKKYFEKPRSSITLS